MYAILKLHNLKSLPSPARTYGCAETEIIYENKPFFINEYSRKQHWYKCCGAGQESRYHRRTRTKPDKNVGTVSCAAFGAEYRRQGMNKFWWCILYPSFSALINSFLRPGYKLMLWAIVCFILRLNLRSVKHIIAKHNIKYQQFILLVIFIKFIIRCKLRMYFIWLY